MYHKYSLRNSHALTSNYPYTFGSVSFSPVFSSIGVAVMDVMLGPASSFDEAAPFWELGY